MPRHRAQGREFRRREVADAEHVQRFLREARRPRGGEARREAAEQFAAVRRADVFAHAAPQRSEEGGLRNVVAAIPPGVQPVGPIHEIARVDAREPVGELEAAACDVVATQVRRDLRVLDRVEQLVDRPAQRVVAIRTQRDRRFAEHVAGEAIEPRARQLHVEVRDDAARPALARERTGQPLAHARMRRDDGVRREHVRRRRAVQQGEQRIEQGLEPTRAIDRETVDRVGVVRVVCGLHVSPALFTANAASCPIPVSPRAIGRPQVGRFKRRSRGTDVAQAGDDLARMLPGFGPCRLKASVGSGPSGLEPTYRLEPTYGPARHVV